MSIREILMERDGMSYREAEELIQDARKDVLSRLEQGEMPEYICEDWFGLEPDYISELL